MSNDPIIQRHAAATPLEVATVHSAIALLPRALLF